jgi:superfamily I DNA/RNA helicase
MRKSKAIFKKSTEHQGEVKIKAMEDALQRMKRETARSVVFHLKDYRENLKFRYFFKLVEAASESFAQTVLERFQGYFSDFAATIERIGTSQSDKEKARQIFDDMERTSRELRDKINRIRGDIETAS